MQKTRIEWCKNIDGTPGYTWNSYSGCLHGCAYCYGQGIVDRFPTMYPDGFKPTLHLHRMKDLENMTNKLSKTIFVSSMGDLFGEWQKTYHYDEFVLEQIYRDNARRAEKDLPLNIFIFLTKNPKGYHNAFPWRKPAKNFWLGITLENLGSDYKNRLRAEEFYEFIGKANTFVSLEPLLASVERSQLVLDVIQKVDWLIVGALNVHGKPTPPSDNANMGAIIEELRGYNSNLFVKNSIRKMEGKYYRKEDHKLIFEERYIPWEG